MVEEKAPLYELISATPSPYARKIRIQLLEKDVSFKLVTEVPWDRTTATPEHNPLEKLPVLIPTKDPEAAIYDSSFIFEWVELHHPSPALLSQVPKDRLRAKQIQVVADGICDALILWLFEQKRGDKKSEPWSARQERKVKGGLKALDRLVADRQGEWLVGGEFGLSDICVGCACGFVNVRWPDKEWQTELVELASFWKGLEGRQSFKQTVPTPQTFSDPVV